MTQQMCVTKSVTSVTRVLEFLTCSGRVFLVPGFFHSTAARSLILPSPSGVPPAPCENLPPLQLPSTTFRQSTPQQNDFSANGYLPINLHSRSKGAVYKCRRLLRATSRLNTIENAQDLKRRTGNSVRADRE